MELSVARNPRERLCYKSALWCKAPPVLAAAYPYDSDYRENWLTCARLGPHVAVLANLPDLPDIAAMEYLLN